VPGRNDGEGRSSGAWLPVAFKQRAGRALEASRQTNNAPCTGWAWLTPSSGQTNTSIYASSVLENLIKHGVILHKLLTSQDVMYGWHRNRCDSIMFVMVVTFAPCCHEYCVLVVTVVLCSSVLLCCGQCQRLNALAIMLDSSHCNLVIYLFF